MRAVPQMAMNSRVSGGLGVTYANFKSYIFYSEATSRANAALAYCFETLWDSSFKIESACARPPVNQK
jgi:hypothetical protein